MSAAVHAATHQAHHCRLSACFLVQNIQLSLDGIAWETTSAKAALVGLSLNLGLNVMLALAAIARLLRARSELRRAALPAGGQHYVEISRLGQRVSADSEGAASRVDIESRKSNWQRKSIGIIITLWVYSNWQGVSPPEGLCTNECRNGNVPGSVCETSGVGEE